MEVTGVMATDAGVGVLWAPGSFGGIVDYDAWRRSCWRTRTSSSTSPPGRWCR